MDDEMTDPNSNGRAKKDQGQAPHFAALDSIRGIAALSVALYHMSWTSVVEGQNYIRNSYLVVDLFFVLSGFVIFYAYRARIRAASDAVRFMWLRFWRLYPLHFTFLVVFLLIECLKGFVEWRFGLVANHPAFSTNNLYSFIGNLFLAQSLHIYNHITFNYPSWSISVEFYTYFVFAIVVLLSNGTRAILTMAALIAAASFGGLIYRGFTVLGDTNDFAIIRCLTGFFIGVLTFAFYEHWHNRAKSNSRARLTSWLTLIVLTGFACYLEFKHRGVSDFAIYPISAALVLMVALSASKGPMKFLGSAPFVWLGTVSYSIYMVHASVEWGVAQFLRFVMHTKQAQLPYHDTPVLEPNAFAGILATMVYVLIVLLLSHFTYTRIEKPLRDWSKSFWRTKQSAKVAPP